METSTVDLSAGLVPKQGDVDLSAGLVPHQPSLDLSNKQGQGVYQMAGPDGKAVPVPYGQVQQAAETGFQFASDADKFRYAKDNAADPNRVTKFTPAAGDPRGSIAYQRQMEDSAPLPVRLAAGVSKGAGTLARPALDAMALRTGATPQDLDEMLAARGTAEGIGKYGTIGAAAVAAAPSVIAAPVAAAVGTGAGIAGYGAGQIIGDSSGMSPAQTAVLSDALGLGGGVAGAAGGATVRNAITDAAANRLANAPAWMQEAAAQKPWLRLAAKVGPTGSSQKTLGVVPALADDLQAIVPQLGKTGARNPLQFGKAVAHFQSETAMPEYANLRDPIANEKLGVDAIQGKQAADFVLPSTQKPLGPNPTIAETEKALREANEIAGPSYQSAANAFDAKAMIEARAVAAQLRTALNNRIGELAGIPPESVSMLRQRIGQAGNIAGNAQERSIANTLGIDSAPSVAMKAGMARSMPARAMRAVLVEPMENWQFRNALQAAQPGTPPDRLETLLKILRASGAGGAAATDAAGR